MTLSALCSGLYGQAYAHRKDLPRLALETMLGAAGSGSGNLGTAGDGSGDAGAAGGGALSSRPLPASVGAYAASLASRTVCLTLLAGSGSRWVKSLRQAQNEGLASAAGIDPEAPRGLYPVRDCIRPESGGEEGGRIPVAAYSLDAVDRLGHHLVVVRGYEDRIRAEIMEPLGIAPGRYSFFTQEAPFGKPLGHGDAAWQCRELWKDADYLVANFGGDANSPLTVLASLLALDALNAAGERVDFLLPAAPVGNPGYPIRFDAAGLPLSFGHAKLQGKLTAEGPGYTNVGVRVYRAKALYEKLSSIHDRFWRDGTGYDIPGNDPTGHEFALDNADAEFAAGTAARVLACAHAGELTPAKSLVDIPAFESAIARVRAEWDEVQPRL